MMNEVKNLKQNRRKHSSSYCGVPISGANKNSWKSLIKYIACQFRGQAAQHIAMTKNHTVDSPNKEPPP